MIPSRITIALKNIENARSETIEASKPRNDPNKKIPFDLRKALMQVLEWDNLARGWSVGK